MVRISSGQQHTLMALQSSMCNKPCTVLLRITEQQTVDPEPRGHCIESSYCQPKPTPNIQTSCNFVPKAVQYNLTGEHHLHIGTQPLATHLEGPEAADTLLAFVPLGEDRDAEFAAYPLLCRMQFHQPAPAIVSVQLASEQPSRHQAILLNKLPCLALASGR